MRSTPPQLLVTSIVLALWAESVHPWSTSDSGRLSRRHWCANLICSTVGASILPGSARSAEELPLSLRDFTKLAPLGKFERSSEKTYNLSLDELARRLQNDLLSGASGQGGYILTGDLSPELFRDDCVFVDPTNRVSSLSQYQKAIRILFDADRSKISLLDSFAVDEESRTIQGRYRSRGFIKLPWQPYVTSYESNIVYKIDDNGLVREQAQTWSKSSSKALQESFTPSLFTPTPTSTLSASSAEPSEATQLFDYVNGRLLDEYSQEERMEIDSLVDSIVRNSYPSDYRQQLPGKWRLVYLQPGPDGAGIDRRIPFPDFSFNNNYQIFTPDHRVTNVGELFGSWLEVRVFGEVEALKRGPRNKPQQFQAHIQGGKLCAGGSNSESCIGLPISGEGLFESVYLGERLRIGQNLNGGGARVVQVRLE
jgi:hypothetical protein